MTRFAFNLAAFVLCLTACGIEEGSEGPLVSDRDEVLDWLEFVGANAAVRASMHLVAECEIPSEIGKEEPLRFGLLEAEFLFTNLSDPSLLERPVLSSLTPGGLGPHFVLDAVNREFVGNVQEFLILDESVISCPGVDQVNGTLLFNYRLAVEEEMLPAAVTRVESDQLLRDTYLSLGQPDMFVNDALSRVEEE